MRDRRLRIGEREESATREARALALVSLQEAPDSLRAQQATRDAQAAGVTNSMYLDTRLLCQAGIWSGGEADCGPDE